MTNYKQNAKTLGVEPLIKSRLEYLRGEIKAERISYGEIAELQDLAKHIEPGDTLLLEWAGVSEFRCPECKSELRETNDLYTSETYWCCVSCDVVMDSSGGWFNR